MARRYSEVVASRETRQAPQVGPRCRGLPERLHWDEVAADVMPFEPVVDGQIRPGARSRASLLVRAARSMSSSEPTPTSIGCLDPHRADQLHQRRLPAAAIAACGLQSQKR